MRLLGLLLTLLFASVGVALVTQLLSYTEYQLSNVANQINNTVMTQVYSLTGGLTPPAPLQPGDALVPHLYDARTDGVTGYIFLPTNYYGWLQWTAETYIYPIYPKNNTASSRLFDTGILPYYPNYAMSTEASYYYRWINYRMYTITSSGTVIAYDNGLSIFPGSTVNSWIYVMGSINNLTLTLNLWIYVPFGSASGTYTKSYTYGSNEYTILNYPRNAPGGPDLNRFSIGADTQGGNNMPVYWGFLRLYSTVVNPSWPPPGVIDVSGTGLRYYYDPTFFDGTCYRNAVGRDCGTQYGGVTRVPTSNPYLVILRNYFHDNYVHLLFFPPGTAVIFSDGSSVVINSMNATVSRTDIVKVVPGNWISTPPKPLTGLDLINPTAALRAFLVLAPLIFSLALFIIFIYSRRR